MKKNTISQRYAVLVLFSILLSVVVIGALGILTLWNKTNQDVVTIMNLTTESKASGMNLVLLKTRDVVDTVAAYVGARVTSVNMQSEEAVLQAGLDEEIQELFLSTVENMEGIVGYNIRYSPPYDSIVKGFSFRRLLTEKAFSPAEEDSNPANPSDVDWYNLAKTTGKPVWVPIREYPYINGYIFSYAVPIYFDEELVGVACVDADFEVLAKPVREVSLFGNGYAYLTDDKGKVYYHPLIGYGVLLTEDEDDVPEVDSALADTSTHGQLISYEYQGQKKKMAFQSLINDMRLVVTANEEDVRQGTNILIRRIVLSAAGIMIVFMFLALEMEKRTMHPALDKMDNLAHLDGLTGTLNKTSFMEVQEYLDKKIRSKNASFGFAMFDANELKKINDRYGHKMGDVYLLSTVEMIQDCFPGCQIFRIGGDEFVVVIEGENALQSAEKWLNSTYTWQEKRRQEKNREPWEKPSVAGALSIFDPQIHHSSEEVLAAADKLMYKEKQQMKENKSYGSDSAGNA